MGMGGDNMDSAEQDKDTAETDKLKAQADQEKAKADAEKAKADQAKSEAEKAKEEAEKKDFKGTRLMTRSGVSALFGILLDDYAKKDQIDALAQTLVAKLKLDDKGFQQFKADGGPLLELGANYNSLLTAMQRITKSQPTTDVNQPQK
jgi:outer membrane murein-binding lipoprotein Lpp